MMNIGILLKYPSKAHVLQEGLILNGNEVTVYHDAEECLRAVLGAKFNHQPLPHQTILVELDLGEGINGPELIRRIRQYIRKNELTFLLINGRSAREEHILSDNLIDIRVLYNDSSVIIREAQCFATGGQR